MPGIECLFDGWIGWMDEGMDRQRDGMMESEVGSS